MKSNMRKIAGVVLGILIVIGFIHLYGIDISVVFEIHKNPGIVQVTLRQ